MAAEEKKEAAKAEREAAKAEKKVAKAAQKVEDQNHQSARIAGMMQKMHQDDSLKLAAAQVPRQVTKSRGTHHNSDESDTQAVTQAKGLSEVCPTFMLRSLDILTKNSQKR